MPAETLSLNGTQKKGVHKGRRMIIRSMEHGGSRGQPSAAANNGILKGGGCEVDSREGEGGGWRAKT